MTGKDLVDVGMPVTVIESAVLATRVRLNVPVNEAKGSVSRHTPSSVISRSLALKQSPRPRRMQSSEFLHLTVVVGCPVGRIVRIGSRLVKVGTFDRGVVKSLTAVLITRTTGDKILVNDTGTVAVAMLLMVTTAVTLIEGCGPVQMPVPPKPSTSMPSTLTHNPRSRARQKALLPHGIPVAVGAELVVVENGGMIVDEVVAELLDELLCELLWELEADVVDVLTIEVDDMLVLVGLEDVVVPVGLVTVLVWTGLELLVTLEVEVLITDVLVGAGGSVIVVGGCVGDVIVENDGPDVGLDVEVVEVVETSLELELGEGVELIVEKVWVELLDIVDEVEELCTGLG